MIFQWALSDYRSHDILLWVMIIFAAVFAFFLLMEYVNTRKLPHLMWGLSLIASFVIFHQVANTGTYTFLFESVGAGSMVLIPGLIATGLLLATFEDKKLIGGIYLLGIIIMTVGIIILGLENVQAAILDSPSANYRWFLTILMLIPALTSTGVIMVIPLLTIITKKTSMKSIFMVIAGALTTSYAIVYLLMQTVLKSNYHLPWVVLGLFPYMFMLTLVVIILGLLYEPEWKFAVPGIHFEEGARIEKLRFAKSKKIIGPVLSMAGGVLLLLTAMLAGFLFPSSAVIMLVILGILLIAGIGGIIIGFAILLSWDWEFRGQNLPGYILLCLGVLGIIFTIVLMTVPLNTIPAVFLTVEGAVWILVENILMWIGPILILVAGILITFVFKD